MNSFTNYKYITKELVYDKIMTDGTVLKIRIPMICTIAIDEQEKKIGQAFPSPLVNFIINISNKGKKGGSLGTQKNAASKLARFLNFVLKKARLADGDIDDEYESFREKGIFGLTRKHGVLFLNSLTYQRALTSTFEAYEWLLNRFYNFLSKNGLIGENILFAYKDAAGKEWPSIFEGLEELALERPTRQTENDKALPKLKDFGRDRRFLISRLLQIAKIIAPEIAFALCLMIFGGLRIGELVNLREQDIRAVFGETFSVQISDNRPTLFKHLKDSQSCAPKRINYLKVNLATQTILDNDLVWSLYKEHEKHIESLRKQGKLDSHDVYFPNSIGRQLSGRSLNRKFDRVWKVFLNGNKTIDSLVLHPDYNTIHNSYCGTHICRGLFTNLLLDMGLTITQVAIARGDRSINSVMQYVDKMMTSEAIQAVISELKKTPIEKIGHIDPETVKNRWKNYWAESGLEHERVG